MVDFKSATKKKEERYIQNYFVQANAYRRMIEELTKGQVKIKQLVILISCDTGQRQEFIKRPEDYDDALDEALQKFEPMRASL